MLFDVANHTLVLAFGLRSIRLASARLKPIVVRQVNKPCIKLRRLTSRVFQDCCFLIIHLHFLGHAAEILETAYQPFIGVFRVLSNYEERFLTGGNARSRNMAIPRLLCDLPIGGVTIKTLCYTQATY